MKINFQQALRPEISQVFGCKEYNDSKALLETIEDVLNTAGIVEYFLLQCECDFRNKAEQARSRGEHPRDGDEALQRHLFHSEKALRCNILKYCLLAKTSYREMSHMIAQSSLYQRFTLCEVIPHIRVPSKSTLQKYANWLPEVQMTGLLERVIKAVADPDMAQRIGLEQELDMSAAYVDSTCLKANIHFPVDWVLMGDAVTGLIASIMTIRRHGLKHRIADPESFISEINKLCIRMSAASRQPFEIAQKARKKILRKMINLVRRVEGHAKTYRDMIDREHDRAGLSKPQAEVIIRRIDNIVSQIPAAIEQARTRIIQEKQVSNDKKILSFHEHDIHVIVRRKSGANVEFGNTLFLVENIDGLIMHHELLKDYSNGDSQWMSENLQQVIDVTGKKLASLAADRGFNSAKLSKKLKDKNIFDATCPRKITVLDQRLKEEPRFCREQKRRAQTEGRIGILKNRFFVDGIPLAKGYEHRAMQVMWAVFSNNLWVVARKILARKKKLERELAKAA